MQWARSVEIEIDRFFVRQSGGSNARLISSRGAVWVDAARMDTVAARSKDRHALSSTQNASLRRGGHQRSKGNQGGQSNSLNGKGFHGVTHFMSLKGGGKHPQHGRL